MLLRRHADQEARNAALLRELTRQRLAFKVAFDDLLEAELAEQREWAGRMIALIVLNLFVWCRLKLCRQL